MHFEEKKINLISIVEVATKYKQFIFIKLAEIENQQQQQQVTTAEAT